MRIVFTVFHLLAKTTFDRDICILSIITCSLVIIISTLADSNLDFLNMFNGVGIWEHGETWFIVLLYLLVFLLVPPGAFWNMWRKFFREFESLSSKLIESYQERARVELTTLVKELQPGLVSNGEHCQPSATDGLS